jgi:pseudaminic acid cytidylyltransferase
MAYSIETALQSGLFERVIVSTDDQEIAEVARSYGAEIPFMRPVELADDVTGTDHVILHAMDWLEQYADLPEYLCCLYATAPFITAELLAEGLQEIRMRSAITTVSVTKYTSPVFRALKENNDGLLQMIWPEYYSARSQDLPEAVHDAGLFYWIQTSTFRVEKKLYSSHTAGIRIPSWAAQDIDTLEDWQRAEIIYSSLFNRERQ